MGNLLCSQILYLSRVCSLAPRAVYRNTYSIVWLLSSRSSILYIRFTFVLARGRCFFTVILSQYTTYTYLLLYLFVSESSRTRASHLLHTHTHKHIYIYIYYTYVKRVKRYIHMYILVWQKAAQPPVHGTSCCPCGA